MMINIEVSDKLILDAIGGATIGYWADVHSGEFSRLKCTITVVESETRKTFVCQRDKLILAVDIMAQKAPKHFAYLMTGNADADTGDLLIQYACFGEARYG
jgi:hypothetical protein